MVEPGNGPHPDDVWYAWLDDAWVKIPPEKIISDFAPDGKASRFGNAYEPYEDDEIVCFVRPKGGCDGASSPYSQNTALPLISLISGPIHAGTWRPQRLDNTFGPQAIFQKGCGNGQRDDLAPCFGLQFFGHVAIDGATEVMTVTLKDVDDHALWSTKIAPQLQKWSHGGLPTRS